VGYFFNDDTNSSAGGTFVVTLLPVEEGLTSTAVQSASMIRLYHTSI
jgi:hypothetical protein